MGSEAKLPEAVWEGTFSVGGMDLTVYVLDDGRRIIGAEGFVRAYPTRPSTAHRSDEGEDSV